MTTKDLAGELADLYEAREAAWSSATALAVGWLGGIAARLLVAGDQSRLSTANPRVKEQERALDKVNRKVAEGEVISTRRDIESAITDLAGVKVLCKSPRDQHALADELKALQGYGVRDGIEVIDSDDYVANPKDSGYRGFHSLIKVSVPGIQIPVVVEVQVKTRLQDAWGELTHEDLYKPGGAMKPSRFHGAVARQMAHLLACVDDLADELANELSESTPAAPEVDPETPAAATILATVRTTGPRYALAVDGTGRQGLISARSVRSLLDTSDYIAVSDHVRVGEELSVTVQDDEAGVFFTPVALHSGGSKRDPGEVSASGT